MAYEFDLITAAERIGAAADKSRLHAALGSRRFELYHPRDEDEVELYVADERLRDAVNVAIATGRPLLLTGEPGTGKSSAANWIAGRLGLDILRFQVKSTTRAQDLLYDFNAIDYFRAAQVAAAASGPAPPKADFVTEGALWKALNVQERPAVLLIDEVDKAPRDFPNDLLFEIDRMEFRCPEYNDTVIRAAKPELRPIVVITSNSERRLPEPFLRRCIFHNIVLDAAAFRRILDRRLALTETYLAGATEASRQTVFAVAQSRAGLETLPHLSALLKTTDDLDRLAQR
jgi:MoxR-like ATPase